MTLYNNVVDERKSQSKYVCSHANGLSMSLDFLYQENRCITIRNEKEVDKVDFLVVLRTRSR